MAKRSSLARSSQAKPPAAPRKWLDLFALIPGYDPAATAALGEWFDVDAAEMAVAFFHECLVLVEGHKGGEPFILEGWQRAIVGCLFGWKREDGTRRYREAFIYVPRKNGKTPFCAGIVNLVMFTDDEPGAQLYSAAAEREQAAIIFKHASGMILREPELEKRCRIYKTYRSIERPETGATYKALSSDADTKHGLGPSLVIVDELHAHPNGELVDVLMTGTAARRQPLVIYITTADYSRESVCNTKYDYACKVRDGKITNSAHLPVIYEAKLEDDWKSPDVWRKANPNLGVSVQEDYLRQECLRAQDEPSYENTFKRLHLNIKTEQAERIVPMDAWDDCPGDIDAEAMQMARCHGGLDLAQRDDLAAFALGFPPPHEDGDWSFLWWFWCPAGCIEKRERQHGVPYTTWARQGLITLTEGDDIDYGRIRRDLVEICSEYEVVDIGYDPYNATHLQQLLREEDGIEMVPMRQGALTMSEPTKYFIGRVATRRMNHGGNPIARWMAANMAVKRDHADNIVPAKDKSTGKIDGIVASVMAMGRAMVTVEEDYSPGVYSL